MDKNCGTIVDAKENIPEIGQKRFERILETGSGKRTKSVVFGCGEDGFGAGSDDVMDLLAETRARLDAIGLCTPVRATLLHLALIASIAFIAEPALAKVVVKKGVYGAIALQRETGQFGYAYNAATSRTAKTEALKQCADPRCEVVSAFSNGCGALARGAKKYFPATGATRQEAETKALRLCAAKECQVAAWACTK